MSSHIDNPLHMMEKLGGSFVRSLAACYYCADPENKAKLRATFGSYFDEYDRRFSDWERDSTKLQATREVTL